MIGAPTPVRPPARTAAPSAATKTPKAPKTPAAKTVKPVTPVMDAGLAPGAPYSKADINLILGLLRPASPSSLASAAGAQVKAATDPVIKRLTDEYGSTVKSGADAIAGYTNSYMDRTAGLGKDTAAGYAAAEEKQGGANAALTAYLKGDAGALGDDLMSKLHAINAGPEAEKLAAASTTGTGDIAAGSLAASGTSVLDRLIEQGASGEASARKIPAIGALAGQQATREFGLQQGKELSTRLGDITSQIPAMVQKITADLASNDANRRQQAASLVQDLVKSGHGNELQKAIARQGFNTTTADVQNQTAQFNAGEINALTRDLNNGSTSGGTGFTANEQQGAVQQAAGAAFDAAQGLFQPQPVVVGKSKDGKTIYRSKNGGRTFDAGQAATDKKAPKYSDAYKQVFNRILPELSALLGPTARSVADQITRQQLAAAGIEPATKKS